VPKYVVKQNCEKINWKKYILNTPLHAFPTIIQELFDQTSPILAPGLATNLRNVLSQVVGIAL